MSNTAGDAAIKCPARLGASPNHTVFIVAAVAPLMAEVAASAPPRVAKLSRTAATDVPVTTSTVTAVASGNCASSAARTALVSTFPTSWLAKMS